MSRSDPMPDRGEAEHGRESPWWRGPRLQLALIALVFALPIIAALLWRPTGYVNHGEIVDPARPLDDVRLTTPAGEAQPLSELRPQWLLLYVGTGDCGQSCRRNLYKMRQVLLTQGDEADRVSYVYVTADPLPAADRRWLEEEHPGAVTLLGTRPVLERLARQLDTGHGDPLAGLHRVYVVDPLGNLMMSYGSDADPTAMRKDLARLLRVSQIG